MDTDAHELLETRRRRATQGLSHAHRAAFGQFFTPVAVARYMASLLDLPTAGRAKKIQLLDPGAGIGLLTAAVAHHSLQTLGQRPLAATCYELEPGFQADLQTTLDGLKNVVFTVESRDFIEDAVRLIGAGEKPKYTHAILNPPYRKIGTDSRYRFLARQLGLQTSNLYTCFLACTIALCRPGAQVVGIIPRSFMNGVYFKPFRHWLLKRVAITDIHVFDRRNQAFSDDAVLQENVILRMVVGGAQGQVVVTSSSDATFADLQRRSCSFSEIVNPGDDHCFFHVPTPSASGSQSLRGVTLRELGLDVCTGPIVDFRLRQHLRMQPEARTVPLLYASHFASGQLTWPTAGRRANAIVRNADTERWLMPRGCYVIVRRLTSKEQKRRVVAYLLEEGALPGPSVGIENHLNVIHQQRNGLPLAVARGLVTYLNSQAVDDYFRTFSGHTQVNAADLRRLRYPSLDALARL